MAGVEVRLTSGRVVRGERAERQGDVVVLFMSSGSLRLDAATVESITESAPAPAGRLNVEGATAGAAAAPGPSAPGATVIVEGPAAHRVPRLRDALARGDLAGAERLLRADGGPSSPVESVALGEIQLRQSRPSDAVATLRAVSEREVDAPLRRARNLALAEALSRLGRPDEAVTLLERTPDADDGRVATALEEARADAQVSERPSDVSAHFAVVAPPGTRGLALEGVLAELERAHADIAAALGGAPEDRIVVLLHPGEEFWDATGQGRHVAALYDGKVRIPVGRIDPPTPFLRAAIRHEVTHAFVESLSKGRADVRWHEGLAGHFEGRDVGPATRVLVRGLREGSAAWPPPVTHETSHARLEWFLSRWGLQGVRAVLAGMASRGTIDDAVRAVTGLDEAGLDQAWRRDLLEGH